MRVRPAPARAPLRGLDGRRLRRRARARARAGPGRRAARRDPALRRGRDRGSRSALSGTAGARRALLDAYLRPAPAPRRLPGDLRLGGRRASRSSAAARWRRARCAPAAPCRSARRAGRAWERGRFDGPYLRDELHRPGLHGRDARDRAHLVARSTSSTGRSAARSRRALRGAGDAGDRHVPPLARLPRRRLALLHFRRPRARPATRSSSGGRSRPPPARRSSPPRGTITHHHAVGRDHAPYMRAEVGETGIEALRSAEGAPRPGRDHEPRQAAAGEPPATFSRRPGPGAAAWPAPALAFGIVPRRTVVAGLVEDERWCF